MSEKNRPLCIRLSTDLHIAVTQLAQNQGMSISEWVRDMLYRIVYNNAPGVEEGYIQGRQIGVAATFSVIRRAIEQAVQELPTTAEDAIPLTQLGSPGRGGR